MKVAGGRDLRLGAVDTPPLAQNTEAIYKGGRLTHTVQTVKVVKAIIFSLLTRKIALSIPITNYYTIIFAFLQAPECQK